MSVEISIKKVIPNIELCLLSGVVPMLHGSPSTAKSSAIKQIADKHSLELIDIRLAEREPTDVTGMPEIKNGRATYSPFDTFPLEGDPIPEGKNGWLLFLDELTNADRSVQKAAYRLILDREVGMHKLHPKALIVAAGNHVTDGAEAEEMGTALQSRMAHFDVVLPVEDWLEWAVENNLDYRITSFIRQSPHKMNTFDPEKVGHTYACPRTWHFLSKILQHVPNISYLDHLELVAACVSEGVARDFITYCEVGLNIPLFKDIVADPQNTLVPTKIGELHMLSGMIISMTEADNYDPVMHYVDRLPEEFGLLILKQIYKKFNNSQPGFINHPVVKKKLIDLVHVMEAYK